MALDVNGYNSRFRSFVEFAQQRVDANDAKAVIDAKVQQPLGGRKILAVTQSRTDEVHKFVRTFEEYAVNDRTRDLFKKAVIDMFGGESKIPASVKKAMLMGDYNAGKPLTARRILAVKAAIDADGTAKARAAQIKLETFHSPEVRTAALGLGYMKSELPKLARAAHFYAQATGVSEMEAMQEVGRPGTNANRLMNYGGRFLQSAENFADGLRLIEMFSQWHDGLSAVHDNISGRPPTYAGLDTPSKVNMDIRASHPNAKFGLERFLFEDIATNPDFNLKETDPERAFGVEHNKASRFLTTAENTATLGTIANMPPEKRRVVYAAFNAFNTLAATGPERRARKRISLESFFLARVIRNLPELESILAKTGTLTGRDVIKKCFPDIRHPGNYDAATIEAWEGDIERGLQEFEGEESAAVSAMLENAGATLREAENALDRGKTLPQVPYFTTAQYSITEASSVAVAGIKTMEGDICRVSLYQTGEGDNERPVFPDNRHAWKFDFPDGQHFETDGTRHADIPNIGRKIKELCGEVHQKQIGSVAFLLSQAGTSALRNKPLAKYGIKTDEHCPVNFSLSRDAATGAVTIRYTSPEDLPCKFEWTATVDVDGKVTSTPMKVGAFTEKKVVADLVAEAARKLGVNLSDAQAGEVTRLFLAHGTNMPARSAGLFAGFLVKVVAEKSVRANRLDAVAADTAASIREWRGFSFDDPDLSAFNEAAKNSMSLTIREHMQPGKDAKFTDNIHNTMIADANRGTYVLNGTTYDRKPADELITAFKTLVPDVKKQRVLSTFLNQICLETVQLPSNHVAYDTGVEAINLPGAKALVNRDMTSGLYQLSILSTYGHGLTHDLQLSEDGKTATITQTITADLAAPGSSMDRLVSFGQVTLSQRLVIDLEPDIPVVTDYKLSQTIA